VAIRDNVREVIDYVPAKLLFVLIGATPHTDWLAGVVQRDARGYILTGRDIDLNDWLLLRKPMNFETSLPGVFAVGDARLGSANRVASAVGEGAGAVQNLHEYLQEGEAAGGESALRVAAGVGAAQT
jgi:thioredoxin reductase (NADPH)